MKSKVLIEKYKEEEIIYKVLVEKFTERNIFYVYIYLDPRKHGEYIYGEYKFNYEPFYVGKGFGRRMYSHLTENENTDGTPCNAHKIRKIKKIIRETGDIPIVLTIEENLLEKHSFELEKKCIKAIGRHDLKKGPLTNLTDGGEGSSGHVTSQETRMKHSQNTTGEKNPNYGKKASPEKLEKMSIAIKKAYEDNPEFRIKISNSLKKTYQENPELQKHLSEIRKGRSFIDDMINLYGEEETERRMKIIIEERSEKNKKPILQYSSDGIFLKEWDSIRSASIFYKASEGTISLCLNGERLTHKGYIWKSKTDNNIPQSTIPIKRKEKFTPVLQYDLNGEFLEKWNSIKEVCEFNNYSKGAICSACKGDLKRVYGFMWKYYKEDNFLEKIEPFVSTEVHNIRSVLQFTLNMEFVRQYKSISEAERINKFGNSAISMVCGGKRKKACGFIWKYADAA